LATTEIPGAINSDPVYRFSDGLVAKSPISSAVFENASFTISVWVYLTEYSDDIIITKTDDLNSLNKRTFALYANGSCDINRVSLPAPNSEDLSLNEWSFMTIVNDLNLVGFYLNGTRKFQNPKPVTSQSNFTTNDLQVAPTGNVGYLDDIKIYKKALSEEEIRAEFEKSYRYQFLNA